jgi:exosortase/archaeosortase family protein
MNQVAMRRVGQAFLHLALLLTFYPTWTWYLGRITDGSDEPWGILSLLTACAVLFFVHPVRRTYPIDALPFVMFYGAARGCLSALPLGAVALMGCAAYLGLIRERRYSIIMLLMLSLPLLSSVQFFAGYPLRVLAGKIAAFILQGGGLPVTSAGAMLSFQDTLVWIDAPCSGIRTFWSASFVLAATTSVRACTVRQMLLCSLIAAPLVLMANVARISFLFLTESGLIAAPGWFHEALGLLIVVSVILFVLAVVQGLSQGRASFPTDVAVEPSSLSQSSLAVVCLLVLFLPLGRSTPVFAAQELQIEWPTRFEELALEPLPLTEQDLRFGRDFPGKFGRFRSAGREVLIRYVTQPTRKLHPVSDCLRGAGYAVQPLPAERDSKGRVKSCVRASRDGKSLKLCEFIEDASGRVFSDPSEWFWAAIFGGSRGPWFDYVVSEDIV